MESVYGGRENWGIPKEYADFNIESTGKGKEKILVKKDTEQIFEIEIEKGNFIFPVNNSIFPGKLIQYYKNNIFLNTFFGKGKVSFATIKSIKVNKDFFPDVSEIKPLGVFKISDFHLHFPKAKKVIPVYKKR